MNPHEPIIQLQQLLTFSQSNFIYSSTSLLFFFFLEYVKANSRNHIILLIDPSVNISTR